MSKLEEKIALYKSDMKKNGIVIKDESLLEKVAKSLGPSIYNVDSSKVAASDPKELETIKKKFLVKKLGLTDGPELDAAIKDVIKQVGSANRNKHRAVFYTLLVEKFNKQDLFK